MKRLSTNLSPILAGLAFFASGYSLQAEENVTIPMSTYQDLLNRLDSLEQRVNAAEARGSFSASESTQAQSNKATEPYSSSGKDPSVADMSVPIPPAKNIFPEKRGGIYGNYEYVYAKPVYSNGTAFYVHDTVAGSTESATLHEFDYDLQGSHRFELGYLNPSTEMGWRVRYWQFDSNGAERSAADVDVKVGVADDPDIAIDTVSATDDDYLIANASTDLDVFDLERFKTMGGPDRDRTVGVGVRYAEIGHHYYGEDFDPTTADFQTALLTDHFFQGAGPTASFLTRRPIGDSNFSFDFGARGSLLFGSGSGLWLRADNAARGGGNDIIRHPNFTKFIPVGEVRLGLAYEKELRSGMILDLGTGFEGQYWLNGGTPLNGGQDGATDSDGISNPFSDDFGVMGFYFRAGIAY